jgi:methylated-DNA-[protein]-cysteine S-methyltransferase
LIVVDKDRARKAGTGDLREAAYILLSLVPPGKVVSYGNIARILGVSPRLIGRFMKENKNPIIIPCHRVIGSDGRLVGYSMGGTRVKRKLLELEGVEFCGDRVCPEYFYDLSEALGL